MYKDNGHDKETIKEWSTQDRLEIQAYREDIHNMKIRMTFWTLKGNMDMVNCISDYISLLQEYEKNLIEKYKENFGINKNTPNINLFGRN